MLQPKVESEAGRMSQKLWELHSQVNDLHLELKRKEAHLNTLQIEKESLSNKFKLFDGKFDSHSREKQSHVEEIIQLKKMKELGDRELSHKEMELLQSKQELERQITTLKNTEHKVITIKEQIGQRSEQEKIIVKQLREEHLNLLKVQSALHEMEEKYRYNTAAMQDKISRDYRDEIRLLHQQLREKDMMRKQDCFLRSKMTDDCTTLVKENIQIHTQILELKKQMDRERMVKEETDIFRTSSAVRLITIKDHKQQLEYEVKRHKERLEIEKNRFKEHMEKILLLEQGKTSLELNKATVLSRVAEEQSRIANTEEENLQLQRDKGLLVDLVTDLQKQRSWKDQLQNQAVMHPGRMFSMVNLQQLLKLSRKEEELSRIYSEIHLIDEDISTLKSQKALEHSVESERWKELSRVSSLATLTGPMSRSGRKFVC